MATPQRLSGNRLITGGAGPDLHIRKRVTRGRIKGRAKAPAPRNQPPLPACWSGLLPHDHAWTTPAKASRTAARTKHRPTETAWAIWSGSNSGLSVEILMLPVYTRPGGASSTSGSRPQGDLSRLRYHPCMVPPRWSDEQGRPLLVRRYQPEGCR